MCAVCLPLLVSFCLSFCLFFLLLVSPHPCSFSSIRLFVCCCCCCCYHYHSCCCCCCCCCCCADFDWRQGATTAARVQREAEEFELLLLSLPVYLVCTVSFFVYLFYLFILSVAVSSYSFILFYIEETASGDSPIQTLNPKP